MADTMNIRVEWAIGDPDPLTRRWPEEKAGAVDLGAARLTDAEAIAVAVRRITQHLAAWGGAVRFLVLRTPTGPER